MRRTAATNHGAFEVRPTRVVLAGERDTLSAHVVDAHEQFCAQKSVGFRFGNSFGVLLIFGEFELVSLPREQKTLVLDVHQRFVDSFQAELHGG